MKKLELPEFSAEAAPEFIDAASAKAWLEHVPLANVSAAQQQLLAQIQEFNRFAAKAVQPAGGAGSAARGGAVRARSSRRGASPTARCRWPRSRASVFDDTLALWEADAPGLPALPAGGDRRTRPACARRRGTGLPARARLHRPEDVPLPPRLPAGAGARLARAAPGLRARRGAGRRRRRGQGLPEPRRQRHLAAHRLHARAAARHGEPERTQPAPAHLRRLPARALGGEGGDPEGGARGGHRRRWSSTWRATSARSATGPRPREPRYLDVKRLAKSLRNRIGLLQERRIAGQARAGRGLRAAVLRAAAGVPLPPVVPGAAAARAWSASACRRRGAGLQRHGARSTTTFPGTCSSSPARRRSSPPRSATRSPPSAASARATKTTTAWCTASCWSTGRSRTRARRA